MLNTQRQRKKGGGRKLFDGKISKRKMEKIIEKYFPFGATTDHILQRADISRSSYYRFINSNLYIKSRIQKWRENIIESRRMWQRAQFSYDMWKY